MMNAALMSICCKQTICSLLEQQEIKKREEKRRERKRKQTASLFDN